MRTSRARGKKCQSGGNERHGGGGCVRCGGQKGREKVI